MPVVHDEKPDAPPGTDAAPRQKASPEVMASEAAAEALLHVGDNRLGTLVAYVQAQRALARAQAQDKNYAAAIATLDAALDELEKPADELREERSEYVRKAKEEAAAAAGDRLRMHPHR
jgi:chromosome segregation ATPase